MEHMKKVNKGLEYMYPNRGKGSMRKNLPENPIVSHIYPIIKKVRKKVELLWLKFAVYQLRQHTHQKYIKKL